MRDLGVTLAAEPALGGLVALSIERMRRPARQSITVGDVGPSEAIALAADQNIGR